MGDIIRLHKPDFSEELIREPTTIALWVELVKFGEARAAQPLGPNLESYLVLTLILYMQRVGHFSATLAVDLLNASTQYVGSKKKEAFNNVGDISLILAGLYPERHRALNVSTEYFFRIGRSAYFDLADHYKNRKRLAAANLYREVGERFLAMTKVLRAMRKERSF